MTGNGFDNGQNEMRNKKNDGIQRNKHTVMVIAQMRNRMFYLDTPSTRNWWNNSINKIQNKRFLLHETYCALGRRGKKEEEEEVQEQENMLIRS